MHRPLTGNNKDRLACEDCQVRIRAKARRTNSTLGPPGFSTGLAYDRVGPAPTMDLAHAGLEPGCHQIEWRTAKGISNTWIGYPAAASAWPRPRRSMQMQNHFLPIPRAPDQPSDLACYAASGAFPLQGPNSATECNSEAGPVSLADLHSRYQGPRGRIGTPAGSVDFHGEAWR